MHPSGCMTNGDYNPPPHPLHFQNDRKLTMVTMIGLGIAALAFVIVILLILK